MKLTTFIMIIALAQVSAKGLAQKIRLNVSNTPIEKVLQSIRQQSGYEFIYNVNDLKGQKISLNIRNVSVEDAVVASIKNLDLDYKIREQNIVLTKKEKGFLDNLIARFQSIDVRGKVVDSLGNGLAGATVSVKGGKQSTQTAANGDFYLKNVEEGAVLLVSYLGYVAKEQSVSKDFNYIQLQQSTSRLDEVQVIAYGRTSRRLSTGNIVSVKAEEISRQNINNPLLALQGKVPNLTLSQQSGLPGAPMVLQLRGQNSLAGMQTEPLIVIDGVPFENTITPAALGDFKTGFAGSSGSTTPGISALSFINPNDIESIEVLSDADATSIYGSRGGNGVIMITTKKGKNGPAQVSFDTSTGFSAVPKDRRVNVLNTSEYLQMRKEAIANDGATAQVTSPGGNGYAPDILLWDTTRYTDWQKELLGGNPGWTNANLSISGGSNLVRYLVSGTYNRQGYVFPNHFATAKDAKYQTGTVHFNLNGSSQNGKLSVTLGGSYSNNIRTGSQQDFTGLAITLAPNAPSIYNSNGELNWEINPNRIANAATWQNPFALLLRSVDAKTNTLTSNAEISYKFISALLLKVTAGYTNVDIRQVNINPIAAKDPTAFSTIDGQNLVTGDAEYDDATARSWTIDPQLSYSTRINKGQFNILVGGTVQRQETLGHTTIADLYREDAFIHNLASAGFWLDNNRSNYYKYVGVFARLGYNWQDKYLVNVNFRRDGSSRFGPGNQYGNFGSIGTAWIFTDEEFFKKNFHLLSFGKLRASYGTSGNDKIPDYQFLDLYRDAGESTYQGSRVLISNASTPDFGWESVRKAEVGLDLGFFNDRVLANLAVWRTRSGNQLGQSELPATGGNTAILLNTKAKVQNTGWDFGISSVNIKTKKFNWTTQANFGIQRNKLLSIPDGFSQVPGIMFIVPGNVQDLVGKPFSGYIYQFDYKGVNPVTGIYEFADRTGEVASKGQDIYPYNKTLNINPKTLGITNTLTLCGFTLFTDLMLVKQNAPNYMSNGDLIVPGFFNSSGMRGNQPVEVLTRWKKNGDITNIQKFTQRRNMNPIVSPPPPYYLGTIMASAYTPWYEDASYIRLRNAQLRYSISNRLIQKIKAKSASLYIQGQNLLTITKYKYADPETKTITRLPILRTYTIGLSANF